MVEDHKPASPQRIRDDGAMAADRAGADAHEGEGPFGGQAGDQLEAAFDIDDRDRVRAVEAVAEGLAGPEVALAEGVFEVPAVPDGRARARAEADVEQDRVRPGDTLIVHQYAQQVH